jgi:hypothetical protein
VENEYYKQIKELPLDGFFESSDDDEWIVMQKVLRSMGYVWKGRADFAKASQFKDNDAKLYWYRLKASGTKQLSIYAPGFVDPLKKIEFDEYFEPTEKHMGHHISKKYGI